VRGSRSVVTVGENTPAVLILSSSLLTDRMVRYTRFLDLLARETRVTVWASSADNARHVQDWASTAAAVERFPKVRPFKEFPYNSLRRLNEFAWDFRQRPPSRLSMARHRGYPGHYLAAVRALARGVALVKGERLLEDGLERFLLTYPRSPEALARLRTDPPAVLLTTNPFWFMEPAVVAVAKKLGIRTLALIPSWDNLSTKNRMVFQYDGYLLWSKQVERELHQFYPATRRVPSYVIGAPQFDVFFQERFRQSREAFCRSHGLRPDRPIILYAVGSPNFIREHHGALDMAERVARGDLGDVQMLVRPHPIHDNGQMAALFGRFAPRVVLQSTSEAGTPLTNRSQNEEELIGWVNTFRHADVVVNLSSTVMIDAAIFDCPVVNLDYDPEPGQPKQALVRDINHLWTHTKPIAESGGVWLVSGPDEMVKAVQTYLAHPELHREKRRWIAEYVCQYLDGRSGERMAEAVLDFARLPTASTARMSL
jgi:hypothetical protein